MPTAANIAAGSAGTTTQGTPPAPAASTGAGTWQAPDEDLGAWSSVSQDIVGPAQQQTGMDEKAVYDSWVAAGRPRGAAARAWKASVLSPANQVGTGTGGNGVVTADPSQVEAVRRQAGLPGNPNSANSTVSLAPTGPTPVEQAIQGIRDAGAAGRGDLVSALGQAQVAGMPQAGQQNQLIQQLIAASNGQGPSAAEALFHKALGQEINAQAATAAGVRGGNAAAAARNAGLAGIQAMDQSRDTLSALRAQEQANARGLLGTTLEQSRAGDVERTANVANIAQQIRGGDVATATAVADAVKANATLEQMKKEAATSTALSLLQTDIGVQGANVNALLQKAGLANTWGLGQGQMAIQTQQLHDQREQAARAQLMQLLGMGLNAGGAIAGFALPGGGAAAGAGSQAFANGLQTGAPVSGGSSNPANDSYWGI